MGSVSEGGTAYRYNNGRFSRFLNSESTPHSWLGLAVKLDHELHLAYVEVLLTSNKEQCRTTGERLGFGIFSCQLQRHSSVLTRFLRDFTLFLSEILVKKQLDGHTADVLDEDWNLDLPGYPYLVAYYRRLFVSKIKFNLPHLLVHGHTGGQ